MSGFCLAARHLIEETPPLLLTACWNPPPTETMSWRNRNTSSKF